MRLIDSDALGIGRCNKDVFPSDYCAGWNGVINIINEAPTVDAVPVRYGRCPVCAGEEVLVQDCDNGYSVEIDAEHSEMTVWQGDTCLVAISIEYCPVCGATLNKYDKQN